MPHHHQVFRRTLMQLLAVASLGLVESEHAQAVAKPRRVGNGTSKRFVVIGAGLAGLAACRSLVSHGHDVLILEARQRIGGRLWTSTKWPDVPLDLGASWIHGTIGNPITQIAQEANARLIETSYERTILYQSDGQELSDEDEEELDELRSQVKQALRAAQDADQDASIRTVIDRLEKKLKATSDTRQLLNFILSGDIEQEYAGSTKAMSAYWHESDRQFDGEDALFVDGYRNIVDFLARDLDIQTDQVVQRIDWSRSPVRITTRRGEFQADKVLVTLPLGVLKAGHIAFDPPLPPSTSKAISQLQMGVLNKCYLRFAKVFWPKTVDWLEYIPNIHGEWTQWVSFARTLKQPVLLGFHSGDRGLDMETWADNEIVASAMKTLQVIFGKAIPQPIDFQITRWGADPYSFGSYSFLPVGSHPKQRRDLAKPLEDRLFFAGEATEEEFFGTAHGAYLSGLRAADEMNDA
jgi:monoamine oxidase